MTRPDLVTAVVRAVAAAEGNALEEVAPLNDYLDPEILDRLDGMEDRSDWRFTFEFGEHQVTVTHESQVYVEGELYRSGTAASPDTESRSSR